MPPNVSFTKEKIFDRAFEIVLKEGINALQARKLSRQLSSSTMAIYHNYKSIEELKKHIMVKAMDILIEYTKKKYTTDCLVNIVIGELLFACEYTNLYRALFIESNKYESIVHPFYKYIKSNFRDDSFLKPLSDSEIEDLFYRLMIIVKGYGLNICAGYCEKNSVEEIVEDIYNLCAPIVYHALFKNDLKKIIEYPVLIKE